MKMENFSERDTEATATGICDKEARIDRGGVLAEMNRVKVTGPQMRAAIEAIQHV